MSVLTLDPFDHEERRERTLWTAAALMVAALHVGLAVGYLLLRPAPQGRAEAPAFDVVFTPAVVSEPAPAIQESPSAEPTPPLEPPKEEPVAREAVAEPVPQPQPEPMPEVIPQPEPVPQVALAPEPPRADDVVLPPPPPPKPVEAKPEDKKPVAVPERVERKPVEKKETKENAEKKPAPKPAVTATRPSRVASAPNPGEDSVGAREGQAAWNHQVEAQIGRAAAGAYPSDGNGVTGTVAISVVIDRNGRLLSRRLAGSSGSPALDRAALSIIERAQPFPRFPPVMTMAQVSRTVPLRLRPR